MVVGKSCIACTRYSQVAHCFCQANGTPRISDGSYKEGGVMPSQKNGGGATALQSSALNLAFISSAFFPKEPWSA